MKDRIRQLMDTQHMNQQTFAKLTGIGSATLSSIFNDRTKPTINHVMAIHKRFPSINLNWLLYGEGGMFEPAHIDDAPGSDDNGLFDSNAYDRSNDSGNTSVIMAEGVLDFGSEDFKSQVTAPSAQRVVSRPHQMNTQQNVSRNIGVVTTPSRKITEIRVFYDDQTWESFVPKK